MMHVRRHMNKRGGCIVSVSSICGSRGSVGIDLPYAVSKHGLNGETLAQLPIGSQRSFRCTTGFDLASCVSCFDTDCAVPLCNGATCGKVSAQG